MSASSVDEALRARLAPPGRRFKLQIWLFAIGYFVAYIPYSAMIRVETSSVVAAAAGREAASVFTLLPGLLLATVVTSLAIITLLGWWRYARTRRFGWLVVPVPPLAAVPAGLGFAVIIACTTLAFGLRSGSVLFALLLLRGGVLILAPLVDLGFRRKIRWFSLAGLALSLAGLAVALADVTRYEMSAAMVLVVVGYWGGYVVRVPFITAIGKSRERGARLGYFVDEQVVALAALLVVPAIVAAVGPDTAAATLRRGYAALLAGQATPGLVIGALYSGLALFGTLIYIDPRENTFCISLNRCSSLLSGVIVSYGITWLYRAPAPSRSQLIAAALVGVALLFLSPFHHVIERLPARVSRRWRPSSHST